MAMFSLVQVGYTDVSEVRIVSIITHCPDDGNSTHLWNVGLVLLDYTASYSRRLSYSYSSPWEPEIPLSFRLQARRWLLVFRSYRLPRSLCFMVLVISALLHFFSSFGLVSLACSEFRKIGSIQTFWREHACHSAGISMPRDGSILSFPMFDHF
jgi:hypothetical protein